jgi:hypothetical protein
MWSNEFTTTYRHLSKGQSGQLSIGRLTGALKQSICSNEYTTTYSYLRIQNLVKWVYHDLLVPSNTQSGQISIRWATESFKKSIWTMSIRRPTETHEKVNLVEWVDECDWLMCRYLYVNSPSPFATCYMYLCIFIFI